MSEEQPQFTDPFDRSNPIGRTGRSYLNWMANEALDWARIKQRVMHRLGMLIPLPPIPGTGVGGPGEVFTGHVTAIHGTSPNYNYDIQLDHNAGAVFANMVPWCRPFGVYAITPAPVGSPCLVGDYLAPTPGEQEQVMFEARLILCQEVMNPVACGSGGGVAGSNSPGGGFAGSVMEQAGYSLTDTLDYALTR